MIFENRKMAGLRLAQKLKKYKNEDVIVLALPRGGVPVAEGVALEIQAPLEILAVRKIGAPHNHELALGAICEKESPFWNSSLLDQLGLQPLDVQAEVFNQRLRIDEQILKFRKGEGPSDYLGKILIIVDDGLATGATAMAAVRYLKGAGAKKVVLAVPVASSSSLAKVGDWVDEVVVLQSREDLSSIGEWYNDFSQVSDEEVVSILEDFESTQAQVRSRKGGKKGKKKDPINHSETKRFEVNIPAAGVMLVGDLTLVLQMKALILFVHGSGSSRKSPRNQFVARQLNKVGFSTLLFDSLTEEEAEDRRNIFNIELLCRRLMAVTQWVNCQKRLKNIPVGYFGASTGAGAAIMAAAQLSCEDRPFGIVSRGGRPDLAQEGLAQKQVPILLIVGGEDLEVLELNKQAMIKLVKNQAQVQLSVIPGATHLFEEAGTLEAAADCAASWFLAHLPQTEIINSPGLDDSRAALHGVS